MLHLWGMGDSLVWIHRVSIQVYKKTLANMAWWLWLDHGDPCSYVDTGSRSRALVWTSPPRASRTASFQKTYITRHQGKLPPIPCHALMRKTIPTMPAWLQRSRLLAGPLIATVPTHIENGLTGWTYSTGYVLMQACSHVRIVRMYTPRSHGQLMKLSHSEPHSFVDVKL